MNAISQTELLAIIDSVDPVAYATERNRHSGPVTRLSPYITRGVISLPEVRDRLLARHNQKDCAKLLQELAWREYFQQVWWAKGEAIFSDLRFARDDWQHQEVVSAISTAATGIGAIDDAINELYETGYMHNHLRMTVASLVCNLGKAHWYEMGRWMYYHLCDGDPASNFCSWQWVAGTSVKNPYLTNQAVLNACSGRAESVAWFSYERETMLEQPVPEVLQGHEQATFTTPYPASENIDIPAEGAVVLYTPWTLNPNFMPAIDAPRVLLIDTEWFRMLPVSARVMSFILEQARVSIPDIRIHVGTIDTVPLHPTTQVHYEAHQTTTAWPRTGTPRPSLHPAVSGYYPSFFKYWQAVTRR